MRKRFTYVILGVLVIIVPGAARALFDDVSLTTGTTLSVTVGGAAFDATVISGTIESIDVVDSALSITLAGGSSIDLTSAAKGTFSFTKNRATANFSCGSSSSVLTLSLSPGQTTETVSVTPSRTVCTSVSSGGGGDTGGTPSTTTTTTTPAPTTTAAAPSAGAAPSAAAPAPKPAAPAPAPAAKPTPVAPAPVVQPTRVVVVPPLTSEINPGARNTETRKLQELLARDPTIYPDGVVSGFYGPKTTAAVKKFQAKYGLPAVGRVGPATLAKLNEVFGPKAEVVSTPAPSTSVQAQTVSQIQSQIQAIQQQIGALTSGGAAAVPSLVGVSIDSELNPGVRNDEVMDLQKLLAQDPEIYPEAVVSGFYGPKTTAAVKKFQAKYGIPTVGRVGPATMAKINEVLGGAALPTVPTAPTTPAPTPSQPTTTSTDNLIKQVEAQIKAIQAQIDALLKKQK